MFPLWDVAIAPVLHAAKARRVVEIGALRGETTVQMLQDLGDDAELHVIDPVPEFDPSEHERAFRGRYFFHEALSLAVIPELPPMDAALIDGDHNWYTVLNELRLLSRGTESAGELLPVFVMHDVLWPYGRRDLYYAPEQIPEEHRQPWARRGIGRRAEKLYDKGGLNPTMCNAVMEGGPRNGVMTALDDFVAEHDEALRVLVLPIYFGLAIVASEARLARQPELAAVLDRLESAEGRAELLEVAEEVRIEAMILQHNLDRKHDTEIERAREKYLGAVKASLLNEHYLDHEVRFDLLGTAVAERRQPLANHLRDPVRMEQVAYRRIARNRFGESGPDRAAGTSFLPYTAMGRPQLDRVQRELDHVRRDAVPGDLVEVGTGRGGGAIFLRAYLDAHEIADRRVFVADAFRSSPEPDPAPRLPPQGVAGFRADLNLVRDGFERFGLLDDQVRFLLGPAPAALVDAPIEQIALLRVGRALEGGVRAVLDAVYDRVAPGGVVVVDARPDSPDREEVEAFRTARGAVAPLERIDGNALLWRRSAEDGAATAAVASAPHLPLAPAAPPDAIDLTVVVVVYNMQREAQRTLQSLSRVYQQHVGDVDYEVIVVENGSDPDQRLGDDLVQSFGPEFRYLDLGADATPSPVVALNHGIRAGRGRAFALMIDGAHVLTPGVLHYGLLGLHTYEPAIVATQGWFVGPGQQSLAMDAGYDQDYEDRLFAAIRWPSAGHRLFEIGHFAGDRDWIDGVWESNCMFVPRAQLEQVGCFDERFSMPGGGYANLELYERLGSSPDVTVCTILGEGSFHQLHGGTTTNQPDATERRARIFGYSEHYAELRGRQFRGPGKQLHYVGQMPNDAARRTKPRRISARAFAEGAAAGLPDGRPEAPIPVPDDLASAFTEAVWRSLPWSGTTWLGHAVRDAPTDLLAYQEAIATVRPDWIIETGTGDGGRTWFLASVCDLVGHGRVLSIDAAPAPTRPVHDRIEYLTGAPEDRATIDAVRARVGDGRALLVLGSCTDRATTVREFQGYEDLVPVGSYVIVTDTIVNGHPVWPAFGPGPAEGAKQILTGNGSFVADPLMEKYSLTFNPGGFLRRVPRGEST